MRFLTPILRKVWQLPMNYETDALDQVGREVQAAVAENARTTATELETFDQRLRDTMDDLFKRMGVRDAAHGG